MAEEPMPIASSPEVQTIATPLNLLLFSALIYIVYLSFRPRPVTKLPPPAAATVFQTYTPTTLLPFNGTDDKPIYFGVRALSSTSSSPEQALAESEVKVFDVSSGRNFYGPGGPYENFAGRDASRGLGKGSFDEDMLTKDLRGPLDPLTDLAADELEALKGWEERFQEKYIVVGRLVAEGSN